MGIRLKDLSKLGYRDNVARSLVVDIVSKHCKYDTKEQIEMTLSDILEHPEFYKNNEIWNKLAERLSPTIIAKEFIAYDLLDEPLMYKTYGGKLIETLAKQQMNLAMRLPVTVAGALMPDAHAGYGLPIGGVLATDNVVPPYVVGVDIGFGMYTAELGKAEIDLSKTDEAAHYIPSGRNVWDGRYERFDLTGLRCYRHLEQAKRLERSLGTLGGGNHFIEIDVSSDGNKYLVIHSGSRNLGKQVAEYYQNLAIELASGKGELFEKKAELIKTYKEQGRRTEIQSALKAMEKEWQAKVPDTPADLCYLYDNYLEDYLYDVEICQRFAKRNRERMAEIILDRCGLTAVSAFHTIHNYIDTKERILRKGAISAKSGELVLIPINMRDGSVLARGKGNPDWNYSAPHGAGRIMSRTKAKETLDIEQYKKSMEGIYTTSVNNSTLDEAPMAYKSLSDIIDVIRESVDVIEVLKPIYNFKACE